MLATICGSAFCERMFWLTKRHFSLVGGWSWHARLPRSRPQHPLCDSQETNDLNTAHLLMWRHAQPCTPRQFRPQTLATQIRLWSFVRWYSTPDSYASWTLLLGLWAPDNNEMIILHFSFSIETRVFRGRLFRKWRSRWTINSTEHAMYCDDQTSKYHNWRQPNISTHSSNNFWIYWCQWWTSYRNTHRSQCFK